MSVSLATLLRASLSGLAGGVGWLVGVMLFFGPAQTILTDPSRQSPKMLLAISPNEPAPLMYSAPWIVPLAILGIGVVYGWTYVALLPALRGAWWQRGMRFGIAAWALMALWFEFYLPWNVLREPVPLVLLELFCWAATLQCVGLAIAGVHALLTRPKRR